MLCVHSKSLTIMVTVKVQPICHTRTAMFDLQWNDDTVEIPFTFRFLSVFRLTIMTELSLLVLDSL